MHDSISSFLKGVYVLQKIENTKFFLNNRHNFLMDYMPSMNLIITKIGNEYSQKQVFFYRFNVITVVLPFAGLMF